MSDERCPYCYASPGGLHFVGCRRAGQVDATLPKPSPVDEYDNVNRPKHYNNHPSGIECIQITEHLNFCVGNAVKYLWRADLKNGVEDLEKAVWYINREIAKRKQQQEPPSVR